MNYDAKRYYAFLGVDPACSDEEIRAAFRRRAKELHPDSESGSASDFIRLKKAYDVLAEPAKRAHYDRISIPRHIRRERQMAWSTPIPRPRRFRLGGMSVARFAAAFVFMAGLSLAAIEVILVDSDVSLAALLDFHPRPTPSRPQPRLANLPPSADPVITFNDPRHAAASPADDPPREPSPAGAALGSAPAE